VTLSGIFSTLRLSHSGHLISSGIAPPPIMRILLSFCVFLYEAHSRGNMIFSIPRSKEFRLGSVALQPS
jgi:hypothetical protein